MLSELFVKIFNTKINEEEVRKVDFGVQLQHEAFLKRGVKSEVMKLYVWRGRRLLLSHGIKEKENAD